MVEFPALVEEVETSVLVFVVLDWEKVDWKELNHQTNRHRR